MTGTLQHSIANPTRLPLLIVSHADGFAQIFGDRKLVDIRVVNCPSMQMQAGEILAEDYITAVIGPRYRDIYYPGNLVTTFQTRDINAADIASTVTELDFVRKIDRLMSTIQQEAVG
jgi:hypothetical protein